MRPTVRGFVRDVVSGYRAEDIYGTLRSEMETEMQSRITERFAQEGLILTDLLVRDISFWNSSVRRLSRSRLLIRKPSAPSFRFASARTKPTSSARRPKVNATRPSSALKVNRSRSSCVRRLKLKPCGW